MGPLVKVFALLWQVLGPISIMTATIDLDKCWLGVDSIQKAPCWLSIISVHYSAGLLLWAATAAEVSALWKRHQRSSTQFKCDIWCFYVCTPLIWKQVYSSIRVGISPWLCYSYSVYHSCPDASFFKFGFLFHWSHGEANRGAETTVGKAMSHQ